MNLTGKRIGIDVDGVLADLIPTLKKSAAEIKQCSPEDFAAPIDWEFSNWEIDLTDLFCHAHEHYDLFATAPPIPGSKDALQQLADQGARLIVITRRGVYVPAGTEPRQAGAALPIVSKTASWLSENEYPVHEVCFVGDKTLVSVDAYIDDAPGIVQECVEANKPAVLFTHCYHPDHGLSHEYATSDWATASEMLADLCVKGA